MKWKVPSVTKAVNTFTIHSFAEREREREIFEETWGVGGLRGVAFIQKQSCDF